MKHALQKRNRIDKERSVTEMDQLFVYGTLMIPEVLEELTGRKVKTVRAILYDFRRFQVSGKEYPAIVSAPGERVSGKLIQLEGDNLMDIITFYEGDEYQKSEVTVFSGKRKIEAFTFIWAGRTKELPYGDWDINKFRKNHLETYLSVVIPEVLTDFQRIKEEGAD